MEIAAPGVARSRYIVSQIHFTSLHFTSIACALRQGYRILLNGMVDLIPM